VTESQNLCLDFTQRSGEVETIISLQLYKRFSGGNVEKSAKTANSKHSVIYGAWCRLLKMEYKYSVQETLTLN